ncbi:MAG: peptide methionine sulfoxide reductase [Maribacter sp.]|uniref:peptide methionine sulfoxide reductase n=1 Tax=Maribacter sp. TaxID=1897614 RepID=UPI003299811C
MLSNLNKIPNGYSEGIYSDKKYGLSKTIFNNGKSFKIFGEELGGSDFISLNYYITKEKGLIKPCEMTVQKVVHFLENVIILEED